MTYWQADGKVVQETPDLRQLRERLSDATTFDGQILTSGNVAKAITALDGSRDWDSPDPRDIHQLESFYVDVAFYYESIGRGGYTRTILHRLYEKSIEWQARMNRRLHKGKCLVKLSEAYRRAGWAAMAERFLFLTLVEDVMETDGKPTPSGGVLWEGGVAWRLAAINGWSESEITRWFRLAHQQRGVYDKWRWCPESVLQELSNDWAVAIPSAEESSCWQPNKAYYQALMQELGSRGSDQGKSLERLAAYVLSCVPGARARRRVLTRQTDLDVFCTLDGDLNDFRQDLGRQWICECKDIDKVGFGIVAKFARVLDSARCKTGLIFTRGSVTGGTKGKWAESEISRLYQQRGIAILVVDRHCLEQMADGVSLLSVLRERYEQVRWDLWTSSQPRRRAGNS